MYEVTRGGASELLRQIFRIERLSPNVRMYERLQVHHARSHFEPPSGLVPVRNTLENLRVIVSRQSFVMKREPTRRRARLASARLGWLNYFFWL